MEITFQSFYLLFYVICTIFKVESHRIFKYAIRSYVLSIKMQQHQFLVIVSQTLLTPFCTDRN